MILLIGNNNDDTLYFDTRLNERKEEIIFNRYKVVTGILCNQSVIIVNDIYTNILSSAIVSYVIEKYFVLFVIKIGKCHSISKNFNIGDVVISKKVLANDIDVCDILGTQFGQIPNFPLYYDINSDLINLISNSFAKCSNYNTKNAVFISSNTHYSNVDQLKPFIVENTIFKENINDVVFESELYGIAVACHLHDIPFIAVNAVIGNIGGKFSANDYIKVLKRYQDIGKAIVNVIGEIGSSDVLRN